MYLNNLNPLKVLYGSSRVLYLNFHTQNIKKIHKLNFPSLIFTFTCQNHPPTKLHFTMAHNSGTVDVAVVGAGLVGSSVAAAIASHPMTQGLSIALIDPSQPTLDKLPPISLRTSTITPSSKEFLEDISVWQHVPESRIARFDEMLIWDSPQGKLSTSVGAISFDCSMNNSSELGWVLDNDSLRYALFLRLRELQTEHRANLKLITSSIKNVSYGNQDGGGGGSNWPQLFMNDGSCLTTRLLIASDGARSRIRTLSGMKWYQKSYGQCAVVATVEMNTSISIAYQRFLSTGPLAVLPMTKSDSDSYLANIVWTTTPAEAHALNNASDEQFLDELNHALCGIDDAGGGYSANSNTRSDRFLSHVMNRLNPSQPAAAAAISRPLPQFTGVYGKRGFFPLYCGHAPSYLDERKRTILVGDAAHNVHPLAGQGVNLGFADANSLARTIGTAVGSGRDIGGENGAPLLQYQSERLPANMAMLGLLHSIQSVFSTNSASAFRDLRRVGISMLNSSSPVKRSILNLMR